MQSHSWVQCLREIGRTRALKRERTQEVSAWHCSGICTNWWNGVRLTWLAHGWFDTLQGSCEGSEWDEWRSSGRGWVGGMRGWAPGANTRPRLLFAWRSSIIETQSINQGGHYSGHLVLMDEAVGWCVCCHAIGQTPEYICMCNMQMAMTPWQVLIAF